MPFYCLTVSFSKPTPKKYPKDPKTIGEHILKRRMDLGLLQSAIEQRMGVCCDTICNWENGWSEPELRYLPAIIEFLDYNPFPKPRNLSERDSSTTERPEDGPKHALLDP